MNRKFKLLLTLIGVVNVSQALKIEMEMNLQEGSEENHEIRGDEYFL
jgi:hypothetical protein